MLRLDKHLAYIVAITVIVTGIESQRNGWTVDWAAAVGIILRCGTAAGVVAFIVWLFDQWLWTLPLIGTAFGRPRLGGTWKARLDFYDGAAHTSSCEAYMVVRQTYLNCSMRLLTETSQSRLRIGELIEHGDRTYSFGCIYHATPHASLRWMSPPNYRIHRGAMLLSVQTAAETWKERLWVGPRAERLVGEFWTDSGQLGTIEMLDCRPIRAESYEAAKAYFDARP